MPLSPPLSPQVSINLDSEIMNESPPPSPSSHSAASHNGIRFPHQEPLKPFSHKPPIRIIGASRWPGIDTKSEPNKQHVPTLKGVWHHVAPFLCPNDQHSLTKAHGYHPMLDWKYQCLPFYKPWPPIRRRIWGFGVLDGNKQLTWDAPSPLMFIHFVWQFLTPLERFTCANYVCSTWRTYHKYRQMAVQLSLQPLKARRQPVGNPTKLPVDRADLFGCALLRFNFIYGDLHRWLGGEYTNRYRNWDATFNELQSVCVRPPPATLPPVSFSRCKNSLTQGVPIKANYKSFVAQLPIRDKYDNHPAVHGNLDKVEAKFAKEEEKSYHIPLPRFMVYFLAGLIINPLQWAIKHGKGRICVDCTNAQQGKDAPGSVNTWIPPPSADNPDECPPIYLSQAFK